MTAWIRATPWTQPEAPERGTVEVFKKARTVILSASEGSLIGQVQA